MDALEVRYALSGDVNIAYQVTGEGPFDLVFVHGYVSPGIGARVAAKAKPGEVLVSQTVRDLVAGSGIEFAERGSAELKGIPGTWHLYGVTNT